MSGIKVQPQDLVEKLTKALAKTQIQAELNHREQPRYREAGARFEQLLTVLKFAADTHSTYIYLSVEDICLIESFQ